MTPIDPIPLFVCECMGPEHSVFSDDEYRLLSSIIFHGRYSGSSHFIINKDCPNSKMSDYSILVESKNMYLVEKIK